MLDRKESARQSLEKRAQVSENFICNAVSFIRNAARHVATKTVQARSVGLFVDLRII